MKALEDKEQETVKKRDKQLKVKELRPDTENRIVDWH